MLEAKMLLVRYQNSVCCLPDMHDYVKEQG